MRGPEFGGARTHIASERKVRIPDSRRTFARRNAASCRASIVLLACGVLAACTSLVRAEITLPKPTNHVADHAGIIDQSEENEINQWLAALYGETQAFVLLVTVDSTDGEGIVGFTQRHFNLWKPGQSGEDQAAIIALATQDRKVRIHTGYGLEPTLPDGWCGSASRAVAAKYFKNGDYGTGLRELAIVTANKVADANNVRLEGIPAQRYHQRAARGRGNARQSSGRRQNRGFAFFGLCSGIMPLLIIIMIISSLNRRRHYSRWGGGGFWGGLLAGHILGQGMRGHRSSWGGGFGSGGFGGGGFGGGGFGGGGFGGGFGGGMSGGGGGGASW